MATGACGIHCDMCKLNLTGACTTCGPGKSMEGQKKIAAQKRLLGAACPILECASFREVDYCMRDCDLFPCENFESGPYPFSQGFLEMQKRRRNEPAPRRSPRGNLVEVPSELWDDLEQRDLRDLCAQAVATPHKEGLVVQHLNRDLLVSFSGRRIIDFSRNQPAEDPLLELITLLYLSNAHKSPMTGKTVGPNQLKEGHFFAGPHELDTGPVARRYGNDLKGFMEAAQDLDARHTSMADASFVFLAFPKIPVHYLLWQGDTEFEARVSLLFDQSIEEIFQADAIWGMVKLVSHALLGKRQ